MSTPPNPFYPPQNAWMLSRPMQVGATVNRVIELLRKNFKLFLWIGLAPIVAEILLIVPYCLYMSFELQPARLGSGAAPTPAVVVLMVVLIALLMVAVLFIYALFETATSWAALQVDAGAEATASQAWQVAWQHPGRSFWLMILRWLRYVGPMLAGMLLVGLGAALFTASHEQGGTSVAAFVLIPLAVVVVVGGFVLGVVLYVADALSNAASVTEDLTAWQAIRRSVQLTRGARWRIFGTGILLYLIVMAFMMAAEVALLVLIALAAGLSAVLHAGAAAGVVVGVLCALIVLPLFLMALSLMMAIQPIYQSVIYRDLRRLEPVQDAAMQPGASFTMPQFR